MFQRFFILALFLTALTIFGHDAGTLMTAEEESRLALEAKTPEEATAHLDTAITLYETAGQEGLANAAFFGNLGSLYLRKGDLGHAILNLKKGLLFAPRDPRLQADLNQARQLRADHFTEEPPAGVLPTLAFFHYDFGYPLRVNLAIGTWIGFLLTALLLLWRRPLWLCALAVFLGIAALLFGSSAAITAYDLKQNTPAVITAQETIPRKGDGEAYTPATSAPLHAGTEITVHRTRGDWSYATLPGGIPAWIKTADLAK